MKKLILAAILLISPLAKAADIKPLLECSEKFSSLTIKENNGSYEIKRSALTNRVKGNPYVYGGVSTESSGIINAKLASATSNKIVFILDNGHFLNVLLVPGAKPEILNVQFESNEKYLVSNLNDILKTSENTLEFYDSEACKINF